jgi:large subunit ribosomal protein L29
MSNKKVETLKILRGKDKAELTAEILRLRREQFSLRMQSASGQAVKPSEFGRVRKNIARVKTLMGQQAAGAKK